MDELNSLYLQMMQLGMLVLRQAVAEHDEAWAAAEIELLHNIPKLIKSITPGRYCDGAVGDYLPIQFHFE